MKGDFENDGSSLPVQPPSRSLRSLIEIETHARANYYEDGSKGRLAGSISFDIGGKNFTPGTGRPRNTAGVGGWFGLCCRCKEWKTLREGVGIDISPGTLGFPRSRMLRQSLCLQIHPQPPSPPQPLQRPPKRNWYLGFAVEIGTRGDRRKNKRSKGSYIPLDLPPKNRHTERRKDPNYGQTGGAESLSSLDLLASRNAHRNSHVYYMFFFRSSLKGVRIPAALGDLPGVTPETELGERPASPSGPRGPPTAGRTRANAYKSGLTAGRLLSRFHLVRR